MTKKKICEIIKTEFREARDGYHNLENVKTKLIKTGEGKKKIMFH